MMIFVYITTTGKTTLKAYSSHSVLQCCQCLWLTNMEDTSTLVKIVTSSGSRFSLSLSPPPPYLLQCYYCLLLFTLDLLFRFHSLSFTLVSLSFYLSHYSLTFPCLSYLTCCSCASSIQCSLSASRRLVFSWKLTTCAVRLSWLSVELNNV